ncbi:LysE family translocator [Saccharopolyspora gloriosae]|uniref:LysE family translocator n=1 Tax=Saccharopolyspora gloriosae TaxID=455344 RepID=UPI001FB7E15C|nr:LysE family translocator [Saccharopolyspora gloriosae]
MTSAALSGFVLVAILGVITPGLDTMLVLRQALLGGRWNGLASAVGITLGCLVWGSASVVGLTALITASEVAYNVVRIAGAVYLIWLGGSALWKSLLRNRAGNGSEQDWSAGNDAITRRSALRSGLVTNLLNPKVGVFYMSLLPQFIPMNSNSALWGGLLVAIHLSIYLIWLPSLVWVADHARSVLIRPKVRRWMDRATAGVLLGLGLKMAIE